MLGDATYRSVEPDSQLELQRVVEAAVAISVGVKYRLLDTPFDITSTSM